MFEWLNKSTKYKLFIRISIHISDKYSSLKYEVLFWEKWNEIQIIHTMVVWKVLV